MSQSLRRSSRGRRSRLEGARVSKKQRRPWTESKGSRRTHEEVVGVGVGASDLEELHQIVELAVDISADGDGAFLCSSSVSSIAWPSSGRGVMDIRQAGHWTRPGGPLLPFRTVAGHRPRTAACRPSSSRSSHRAWGLRADQRAPS
jgi:hypothetical protein